MRQWTPEQRAQQAEIIRAHQPWKNSTGPKTPSGKRRAAMNAVRHGDRTAEFRRIIPKINEALMHQREFLRLMVEVMSSDWGERAFARQSQTNYIKDTVLEGVDIADKKIPKRTETIEIAAQHAAAKETLMGASFGKELIMFENPASKLPSFPYQSEPTG